MKLNPIRYNNTIIERVRGMLINQLVKLNQSIISIGVNKRYIKDLKLVCKK